MSGTDVVPATGLLDRARAWADADPDPVTQAQLRDLLARAGGGDEGAGADLADRFAGTLAFGTAGLRGALGAGPNRMNRVVVIRAAAGLAAYLLDRRAEAAEGSAAAGPVGAITTEPFGHGASLCPSSGHRDAPCPKDEEDEEGAEAPDASDEAPAPTVVIGYDARHGSASFARDTAAVMTGAGVRALLLPRALPTPVLAFAVRHLGTDAGVMVTASHNPAADNGYKVYLGGADGGSQIVPPADAAIAAAIAAVGDLADLPRPDDGWEVLGDDVLGAYLDAVTELAEPLPADDRRGELSVVLTPMHGVGGDVVLEALRRTGVRGVCVVPEQAEPDPDFPTVAFPNPEEPGALDLAIALARERGADVVIAVDPDADRCAVAVADPLGPEDTGGWRPLTGDELGAVLGEQAASGAVADDAVLACSLVSSRLLGRIAAAHGLAHAQTLTGFKWISRVPGMVFGYEEAIGYCVAPGVVRDKDGISAAVVVAALAADLAADGRTLLDVLDDLALAHGVHATGQASFRVEDLSLISAAVDRLRADPPVELAGSAVVAVDDLALGSVETTGVPPTEGLRWSTASGARVVVRPSGTEPKLKCYLEVVQPVGREGDVATARADAATALSALRAQVVAAVGL